MMNPLKKDGPVPESWPGVCPTVLHPAQLQKAQARLSAESIHTDTGRWCKIAAGARGERPGCESPQGVDPAHLIGSIAVVFLPAMAQHVV